MYEESERVIRERIETTRERLGETIEEIGERVNPTRVRHELKTRARNQVDEMKANMKRKARNTMHNVEDGVTETGRGVWHRIRENPIPAGMVGVGLAWLMANGGSGSVRRGRQVDYGRYRETYAGDDLALYGGYPRADEVYGGYATGGSLGYDAAATGETGGNAEGIRSQAREKGHEAVDRVREKGHEAADLVREKGHMAADSAREKTSELRHRAQEGVHDARERARQWGHEAQYQARRMEHRVEDSVQENPIAASAIAAALGFAAGMMIPESQKEREMFGPARDRLAHRARSTARQVGEKAKDVARETAGETAKRAMDEVMHTGSRGDNAGSQSVSEPGR